MKRLLFCELSPATYKISVAKQCLFRKIRDSIRRTAFAKTYSEESLPHVLYKHNSLIRRKLGNVDMHLQENKANNLALATPKVNHILIRPGETFSFWRLVGNCTYKKGYREGVTISSGSVTQGIGGGMCQFTNLIHWMALHSPLEIVEHHHHDQLDLFPDFNRQVPFGVGTSIMYNYLDYRVANYTDSTFQLLVWVTDTHLCGELRSDKPLLYSYHIESVNEFFSKEADCIYRNGQVFRKTISKHSGNIVKTEPICTNHARVCYDASHIANLVEIS